MEKVYKQRLDGDQNPGCRKKPARADQPDGYVAERVEKWSPGAEEWGTYGEAGKRVESFSYKINKGWGI